MPREVSDGPRYGPAQRLLRMALLLASSQVGMSIDELGQALDVSRKTAERLRDVLAEEFPALEYTDGDDRVRRWRLPTGRLGPIATPRPDVVAAVENVARNCEARGEPDRADLLREAASALLVRLRPEALRRVEPDIEALMETEGTAMHPGSRPDFPADLLQPLRHAILAVRKVELLYESPSTSSYGVIVCPYGVLRGGRGWLVAHTEANPEMRLWRLDRIRAATELEQGFDRGDFDLQAYAVESFGTFPEPPAEVVLRIAPDPAENAQSWLFHPSQTTTRKADGSLLIRFRAGGTVEMCWHFFTWGDALTILAPDSLREQMAELTRQAATHHQKQP